MIRESLYKKTVDILFQAYFNDTLQHGNCCACAVGNLVAANLRIEFIEYSNEKGHIIMGWKNMPYPGGCGWGEACIMTHPPTEEGKRQINSTGYSISELAFIESAFESAPRGKSSEDYMFNGLLAVLDELKEIHEVENDEQRVRFRNHYTTKKRPWKPYEIAKKQRQTA